MDGQNLKIEVKQISQIGCLHSSAPS